MAGRFVALGAASLAALWLAAAARPANPQIAGLQVALRAYGLYGGPVDAIAGPRTVSAVKAFQRRAGVPVNGRADLRTRKALGPLGRPLFGKRQLHRRMFGWDVAVLQFMLARRGQLVPVYGYFDQRTAKAVRHFQRAHRLAVDGIAGPKTLAKLGRSRRGRGAAPSHPSLRPAPRNVRAWLEHWARVYRLDPGLVRALAWMESGYQPNLVSRSGAQGVMQVLPSTRRYVETVLVRRRLPHTLSGDIQVGTVYLRAILHEFHGNVRRALAAWYQGPASVRRHGIRRTTRAFVADVLALRGRGV